MSGRKSIRADKVSPRKSKRTLQMVDVKGFPLRSEPGPDLVTDKESYDRREYEYKRSTPVILDSDSYKTQGYSTGNALSKGLPAALPIIEQFPEQSEVSRTLLGINRETTQQSLFSNVSVYGLDSKDWEVKISGYRDGNNRWWTRRPSLSGNYGPSVLKEDDRNAALRITSNPTPYLEPRIPTADRPFTSISQSILWGQYINTIVAMYIFKYMVKNFSREKKLQYNLNYLLSLYPTDSSGSFNDLAWDKIWLDISQNRFGSNPNNYPLIPKVQAFNFKNVFLNNSRSPQLWGSSSVIIQEANLSLPSSIDFSWDKENFSIGRMFFPDQRSDNKGHFYIKTNPDPQVWQKYFGLRWNEIKPEIRNWEFTVHESEDTVTDIEKQLKLPYVIIENTPQRFNSSWPNASETNLPVDGNRIGGSEGIDSGILLKSVRSFRYQPGRISGFTYGVKLSEIGAGPGTTIEFGIENKTDSYMFRLTNGGSFSIVRRSVVPLDDTLFLSDAKYLENTKTVVVDGEVQYETVIGQNIMNGDPLSGEGESGYILDPDTVTMFKIEFGWYGAIGAKFYAYVPFGNNECRWVTLHTLVIENQLKRPCLGDPFFYFTYKLNIQDSRTVRLEQFLDKFGASYYIDGYDEGNSLPQSISSGVRSLERNIGGSDIRISPLDWTTLIGLKPRRFVTNASGEQILNKKEIYPQSVNISSSTDCEIKIIRQKGCPEFAYNHQEGYRWQILPESRRLRARFSIIPYFELDLPSLGIIRSNKSTHTAIAAYSTESSGNFRDPRIEQNWGVIGEQPIRILANDVFGVFSDRKSFEGGSVILNLKRPRPYRYLSSRLGLGENIDTVKLPFTYAPIAPNELGYNLEIDYFRRDQILLSTVDINSNEFYIYWTGGRMQGPNPGNFASMRFGFCWPNVTNPESPIYAEASSSDWGIEEGPLEYDGENFYEGLPYDFVQDYSNNCLYIETGSEVWYNTYGLEIQEEDFFLRRFTNLDPDFSLSVPGVEGGTCRGLFCKYGRELRDQVVIISEYDAEQDVTNYYISDPNSPWPNLSPKNYTVTILQGGTKVNIETTGGITRIVNDAILYLIPIGETLPEGLAEGFAKVYYSVIYIARMNQDSQVIEILASEIAPGDIPFVRVFIQARQGAQLGGVWVGQKTSEGIKVNPFTPHRSTLSISDDGIDFHGQWSSVPETDGALKVIAAYQQDQTAPTIDASEDSLQTFKSIHSSPKKCGSFTFPGGTSSAGVFIGSEYPLRSFTQPSIGVPVTTYYVSANTPTQIDLSSVFYVGGEGITSNSFGDVATFVVGRSLDASGDVQISLNYIES